MIDALAHRVLAWDALLQTVGGVCSVIGVAISLWLVHETWLEGRATRFNGLAEQIVARSHLRSQMVILALQLSFAVISFATWTLPPFPSDLGPAYDRVVLVIVMRKLLRALAIVLLTWAASRQAQDRRRVLRLLRIEPHMHQYWDDR